MNSESGQRLSLEELKQLNRSQTQVPPKPPPNPQKQDREDLLATHGPVPAGEHQQRPAGAPGGQCFGTGGPVSGVEADRWGSSPPRPSWRRWRGMWPK